MLAIFALLLGESLVFARKKPHLLFVLVDDFGWGNVGYHRPGFDEVRTPHIDQLVAEGIELNRHYVHPMCTPTRTSLQTGRLPVHVNTKLFGPCNPSCGIPTNMSTIASKLKLAGYKTHLVGKWDAGMVTPKHTPHGRGYDTSLNYFDHGNWGFKEFRWEGSENNTTEPNLPVDYVDFWDTDRPCKLNNTKYEEQLFFERMHSILQLHDPTDPLFMVYTPKIAHYPLQAPEEYQKKFDSIEFDNRKVYAAMVNYLDDNINRVVNAYKQKGMWEDTIMVLSSDNGGYVLLPQGECYVLENGLSCWNGESGANNYPHRGGKYSNFEGGIRVNAFVSGGALPDAVKGTKTDEIVHIADWYTTFCDLAGVDPTDTENPDAKPVDGLSMANLILGANLTSPRTEFLVDNGVFSSKDGAAFVHKQWKLLIGDQSGATWAGPKYPNATTMHHAVGGVHVKCPTGCLFDVVKDPEERTDLAAEHPDVVKDLEAKMDEWIAGVVDVTGKNDPKCQEFAREHYGGYLGPWMDVPEGYGSLDAPGHELLQMPPYGTVEIEVRVGETF